MDALSIRYNSSLSADHRAQACEGDSHASSGSDFACTTTQSVLAIASPHELHGSSSPSSSTGTRSFCCNQQYSITAITTSTGTIAERYAYSAYGQPTILDASASVLSSSSISNRYTYTGREWDATLGLYHFRARWMSPIAGRLLSRDPIGYEDGDHLYRNAMGLIRVDPSGNWVCNCNCTEWQYSSGSTVPLYSSHSYEYKFIVAAGNPSQQQALVECNAACDIDRSSTSSCSGSGKRCSGSIQTNWTPDESKAFGICSKINKSLGKCSNCTQAD